MRETSDLADNKRERDPLRQLIGHKPENNTRLDVLHPKGNLVQTINPHQTPPTNTQT